MLYWRVNAGVTENVLVKGGIADALRLAEHFADGEAICVVLGDNIIQGNVARAAEQFRRQRKGVKILLKEVKDPQRFDVPILEGQRVAKIEDKPANPRSPYAVTGICFYDGQVFEFIRTLIPSARGELEITDGNNVYIKAGTLIWGLLDGWWTDAGTIESLYLANQLVSQTGAKQMDGV